jgi:hypothetical protein
VMLKADVTVTREEPGASVVLSQMPQFGTTEAA